MHGSELPADEKEKSNSSESLMCTVPAKGDWNCRGGKFPGRNQRRPNQLNRHHHTVSKTTTNGSSRLLANALRATVGRDKFKFNWGRGAQDGHLGFHTAPEL